MKRSIVISMLMIAAAVLLIGCGKEKAVYESEEGKVTVESKKSLKGEEQTVQVETEEHSASIKAGMEKSVSEAELGVPVYPGAKLNLEGKYQMHEPGQAEGWEQRVLSSGDDFDKVVAFYKSRLKNLKNEQIMSSGDQKFAMFHVEDGKKETMVHITRNAKEKQTIVQVMKRGG